MTEDFFFSTYLLKVRLCLELLELNHSSKVNTFLEWPQKLLCRGGNYTENSKASVHVSIVDYKLCAGYVSVEANLGIDRLFDFLFESGISDQEIELFTKLVQRINPELLGTWLKLDKDSLDGGWHFPLDISLALVWDCIAPSPDKDTFINWTKKHELADCQFLRHSIGQPTPMTELFIPLPNRSLSEQLDLAASLFKALEISWFSKAITDTFQDFHPETIGLVAAFTTDGTIRLGIFTPHPSLDIVLVLSSISKNFSDEKLATIEGILDIEGPENLILYRDASGLGVELQYAL